LFGFKRRRDPPAAPWPERRPPVVCLSRADLLAMPIKRRREQDVTRLWTAANKRPKDIDALIKPGETMPEMALAELILIRRDWPRHKLHDAQAQCAVWWVEGWLTKYAGKYTRPLEDPKPADTTKPKPVLRHFHTFDRVVSKMVKDEDGYEHVATKVIKGGVIPWPPTAESAQAKKIPADATHWLRAKTIYAVHAPQIGHVLVKPGEDVPITSAQAALFANNCVFEAVPMDAA
jgi:hypothetical protein